MSKAIIIYKVQQFISLGHIKFSHKILRFYLLLILKRTILADNLKSFPNLSIKYISRPHILNLIILGYLDTK